MAGLLRDPYILENLGAAMANPFHDEGITKVIAPEARGPVLGALVATCLKAGLVLVRKEGRNHPGADQTLHRNKRGLVKGYVFLLDHLI